MPEFEWDDANRIHLAGHAITPQEAMQALRDPARVRTATYRGADGEPRSAFIGETESGRLLVVIYTLRKRRVRVVTAYDANARDRTVYRRKKRRK